MGPDAEAVVEAEFERLYSMLRLTPACTPDDLHRAYRRAIAELHPDRAGPGRSPEQQAHLRDLISLHAKATEFHRRHGRLPGANPGLHPRHSRPFLSRPLRAGGGKPGGLRRWLIFLPLLAFVAWQLVDQDTVPSDNALEPPTLTGQ